MLMIHLIKTFFIVVLCTSLIPVNAQQITGVWGGKINRKRAEVKFVQKGDSITGTSYYYESGENYLRYSIKGYFDASNNSVVWWAVSYTHLRAHETPEHLVCRLLLE